MAVSKRILDLIALALQDRVLTFKERQIIMEAAVKEGTSEAEINAVIDNMLAQRLGSFTKEELGSCPGCGHGVPLLADECPYCGTVLRQQTQRQENPINISDKDAEIIRSENVRVEEEKKKIVPNAAHRIRLLAIFAHIADMCCTSATILTSMPIIWLTTFVKASDG
jgi:hypothetical protein